MTTGRPSGGRAARPQASPEADIRQLILAEVATLYYVDRLNQEQIARQIGRSVSTVSRFLADAEATGIVEVRVHQPTPVEPDLQLALAHRFGLRCARVLRTSAAEPQRILPHLGNLAARYLTAILADDAVISVGWGTSLYEVVQAMTPGLRRGFHIVQALGSLGNRLPAIDNHSITRLLAERIGGTPHFLPAPMIVESEFVRDALVQDPQLRETLALARRSDIALVGVGGTEPEQSGVYRAVHIDAEMLESIRDAGAVGDIAVEFFDRYGRFLDLEVSRRVVGTRLSDLRDARTVIAVAGGASKALALLGALRTGVLHVLITDDTTATRVLELADAFPEKEAPVPARSSALAGTGGAGGAGARSEAV